MKANSVLDLGAGLLLVALVTTVVTSKQAAGQITAAGAAMGGLISAALGKGVINR